ncbi:hypothetical protein MKW94_007194 [Papaver nudicaule]|uniref:F-box associated beta-propeller type 3 domain-containing protein n=1 Tax=Papaver nudicaule TaxID=74823 RepID=A0AA41SER7_PAPNU|nr:hypothetical protein [Papaver nudicaule]
MEYRRVLDWNPSLDPVVNTRTRRIPCKSCIGPPRSPSAAFAVLSQTYYFPLKTMHITSVEEGCSSKDNSGWKADLRVSIPFNGTAEEFFMLSCKYLICLYGEKSSYICNPATGELRTLAKLHERDGIGFGFDATRNQYKLVLLHLTSESTWCDVFALGTSAWTRVKNDDPTIPTNKGKASCPTTIGESIYWITAPRMHVLSFNVQTGKFTLLGVPMYIQSKRKRLEQNIHISLAQVLGTLCIVQHNGVEKRLDIWTKNEGNFRTDDVHQQWMRRSSIDLNDPLIPEHTVPGYHVTLMGFRGGKIMLWSTWAGLVSYDVKTHEFKRVYNASGWNQVVVYEKS